MPGFVPTEFSADRFCLSSLTYTIPMLLWETRRISNP